MKKTIVPIFCAWIVSGCSVPERPAAIQARAPIATEPRMSVPKKRKLEPLEELVRARARLSEDKVLALAQDLASREHRNLSSFDQVEVRAHMSPERKIGWSILLWRSKDIYVGPADRPSIEIDDETGRAEFDLEM